MNTTNWPPVPPQQTAPIPKVPLTEQARNELLEKWRVAKAAFDKAKSEEMQLRLQLNEELFDPKKLSGTLNYDLGNGWKLKCERKQYHNLSNKDVPEVREHLSPDVAERIFRTKYELSISEFKRLKDKADSGDAFAKAELRLIEDILTVTPGTPAISLVPPKESK